MIPRPYWIRADQEQPEVNELVWVKTTSGVVATGYWIGFTWIVNGFRILDPYDDVISWEYIDYPE